MSTDVYKKLALRLNSIPNGYPETESGIELKVLAKIFEPQEAVLAAEMQLEFEPADAIASRAGVDPKEGYQTLKQMARNGQIRVRKGESGLVFALMPFVVGIYEEQLPRLDAELAGLTEQYFKEIAGRTLLDTAPSIHRVVAVSEAVPFDLQVHPYERAVDIVESAKSWGVRDCICRVQKKLVGEGCDLPMEVCMVLAPVEDYFREGGIDRPISKEEALEILSMTEEAGLVHTTGNYRDGNYYICNCCPCCCGIMRGLTEFDVPTAVAHSGFQALVDEDTCTACEICIDRCPVEAITMPEATAVVDPDRCIGCGVCIPTCADEAIHLVRRPEEEILEPPANLKEWMMHRAHARGLEL